jgi:phosphate:Na+ symporter
MFTNWLLILSLFLLGYLFWSSSDFQVVATGVVIFLFGMRFLEDGFKAFTGGTLEKWLQRSTDNISKSLLFGTTATAIMQSSSLVTVITISFLSAGLIGLTAGIGIIYGANIGTTTGAWLMAGFGLKVNISSYAMPLIVFGSILVFQKKKKLKGLGRIVAGMGFVFLGIHYMKTGFEAFSGNIELSDFAMTGLAGLLVYTGIGIAATVVMQSSHATLMITITALAADQVTYENGLALAIGSNIGTTVTAILGAMNANAAGRRLALAHLIFNIATGLIAIVFINQFRWCVEWLAGLMSIAGDDWTLKLAAFHSLFNIAGVLVMVPLIPKLVPFLERKVTEKAVAKEKDLILEPIYLNQSAITLPDTAIEVLLREVEHLFENLFEIVAHSLNLHRKDILSDRDLDEIVERSTKIMKIDVSKRYDQSIKILYNAIIDFATRAPAESDMNENQMATIHNIRIACRNSAEIVKITSYLRKNVSRYMNSENQHIRKEYNLIRKNIAHVLRTLFQITELSEKTAETLNTLKSELKKQDVLANGTLDTLVRTKAIDPRMATSLMNDNAFAYDISNRCIENAERIMTSYQADLKKAEDEMIGRQE